MQTNFSEQNVKLMKFQTSALLVIHSPWKRESKSHEDLTKVTLACQHDKVSLTLLRFHCNLTQMYRVDDKTLRSFGKPMSSILSWNV